MTGLRTKSVTKTLENVCVWLDSLEKDVKLVSNGVMIYVYFIDWGDMARNSNEFLECIN